MEQLSFFEKSVKIVDKYGTIKVLKSIILVGLFLFVIFCIPMITQHSVEKSIATLEKNKELVHIKDLEQRRAIQPQIYSTLETLMRSTEAQRAFIIELHNGSQNINGVPFLHGTVTYEKVSDGYDNIDEEYQNLSLSRYELSTYLHNNFHFIGTIDELKKVDKKIAAKLAANEVSYVAVTTLHDGTREWGWFGVLYSNNNNIPSEAEILNDLLIHSQTITKVLANIHK